MGHRTTSQFAPAKRFFATLAALPFLLGSGLLLLMMWSGCNRIDIEPENDYPDDIAKLMRKTCATRGCHNSTSAAAAGGLNLESWASMFEGSRGGSPVIPYSPDQSYFLYSVNNDTSIGPTLAPTMPYNQDPLSPSEYEMLWQWINDGARNGEGQERFPPRADRKKWYIGHSECDEVAVIDVESRQVMRYVEVGTNPEVVENLLDLRVSPDGQDWYVVFSTYNTFIERYSTLTDEKVATIDLGNYGWNRMEFSHDGRYAFVAGDYFQEMVVVDLQQNVLVGDRKYFAEEMANPVLHPQRQEIYMAQHFKSAIYAVEYDANGALGAHREIDLLQGVPSNIGGELWPHDLVFTADGSRYYVSSWQSGDVRVFDGSSDSLIATITLPGSGGIVALSPDEERLYVSCMNDASSWNNNSSRLGSIISINTNSLEIETTVYSGFQPYSIDLDAGSGVLLVANRNTDVNGPQPHHQSTCGDRNGYLTLIDLNTNRLVDGYKPELLADPICIAVK